MAWCTVFCFFCTVYDRSWVNCWVSAAYDAECILDGNERDLISILVIPLVPEQSSRGHYNRFNFAYQHLHWSTCLQLYIHHERLRCHQHHRQLFPFASLKPSINRKPSQFRTCLHHITTSHLTSERGILHWQVWWTKCHATLIGFLKVPMVLSRECSLDANDGWEEWKLPTMGFMWNTSCQLVPEGFGLLVQFIDAFLLFLFVSLIWRVTLFGTRIPDMYTAAVYLFGWQLQNHVAVYDYNIPRLINQVKTHLDSCHPDSGAELF